MRLPVTDRLRLDGERLTVDDGFSLHSTQRTGHLVDESVAAVENDPHASWIGNILNGLLIFRQCLEGFGLDGDIPVTDDFDGDNISDIAVFRPSDGAWYFIRSSTNTVGISPFGRPGDIPASADYDGDAKTDLAIFRPTTGSWWVLPTISGAAYTFPFGLSGDIPVPGDYDGDGRYDIAVWRSSNGA